MEQSDSSYMPNLVVVSGGNTIGGLKELKQTTVPTICRECVLITGLTEVCVVSRFCQFYFTLSGSDYIKCNLKLTA